MPSQPDSLWLIERRLRQDRSGQEPASTSNRHGMTIESHHIHILQDRTVPSAMVMTTPVRHPEDHLRSNSTTEKLLEAWAPNNQETPLHRLARMTPKVVDIAMLVASHSQARIRNGLGAAGERRDREGIKPPLDTIHSIARPITLLVLAISRRFRATTADDDGQWAGT